MAQETYTAMEQTTFQYTYPADYGNIPPYAPGKHHLDAAIDKGLVQNIKEAHMRFPTLLAKLRKEAEVEARQARRYWIGWRQDASGCGFTRWERYDTCTDTRITVTQGDCGTALTDSAGVVYPLREYWYRQLGKESPSCSQSASLP